MSDLFWSLYVQPDGQSQDEGLHPKEGACVTNETCFHSLLTTTQCPPHILLRYRWHSRLELLISMVHSSTLC